MSKQVSLAEIVRNAPAIADPERRMDDDVDWMLSCEPGNFERIKYGESFWQLVSLGRVVNGIRYVQEIERGTPGESDGEAPSVRRRRTNSLFYAAAVWYEGMRLAEWMVRLFRTSEAFENGLHTLLRDPKVGQLRNRIGELRDRGVFHFLPVEIGPWVARHSNDDAVFSRSRGPTRGETYYELADRVILQLLVGSDALAPDFGDRFAALLDDMTAALVRYVDAAGELMREQLPLFGFRASAGR